MKKTREFGPDLVRAVAVSFVLAVHYFLYTGFYDLPLQGPVMAYAAFARMALMTCVPLFLMLTGWLCVGKKWSMKYYRGLLATLITYVLACLVCLAFKALYLKHEMILMGWVRRILDFTAAPYAWYVEMYIGLFLLIPFFNAAWHSIGEGGKKALILTLVLLSSLPTVTNETEHVLPDWWLDLYPLCYYALGAWLREHPMKVKKIWFILGWLVITGITTAVQFDLFEGGVFAWSRTNNRGSLLVLGETVCIFAAMISVKGEKLPKGFKWCIKRLAALSFPVYLVSYIGDSLIYPVLCERVPEFAERLYWHVPCVLLNIVFSCLIAQMIEWISRGVMRLVPEGKKREAALGAEK